MSPQPGEAPERARCQQPEATDRRERAAEQRQCDDCEPGREPCKWRSGARGGREQAEIEDGRGEVADAPGIGGERAAEVLDRVQETEGREMASPCALRPRPGEWIVQDAIEVEREGGRGRAR